jgi:hypothetical protein
VPSYRSTCALASRAVDVARRATILLDELERTSRGGYFLRADGEFLYNGNAGAGEIRQQLDLIIDEAHIDGMKAGRF